MIQIPRCCCEIFDVVAVKDAPMLTDGGAVTQKPGLGLFFWWRVRCIVVAVDCALAVLEGWGLPPGCVGGLGTHREESTCRPMKTGCL